MSRYILTERKACIAVIDTQHPEYTKTRIPPNGQESYCIDYFNGHRDETEEWYMPQEKAYAAYRVLSVLNRMEEQRIIWMADEEVLEQASKIRKVST